MMLSQVQEGGDIGDAGEGSIYEDLVPGCLEARFDCHWIVTAENQRDRDLVVDRPHEPGEIRRGILALWTHIHQQPVGASFYLLASEGLEQRALPLAQSSRQQGTGQSNLISDQVHGRPPKGLEW
jgi:hypothetical protein